MTVAAIGPSAGLDLAGQPPPLATFRRCGNPVKDVLPQQEPVAALRSVPFPAGRGEKVRAVAAVTATVKDDLSALPAGRACCRRAEVSALLRFAGELYLAGGRVQIVAELDNALVAGGGHQTTVSCCGE